MTQKQSHGRRKKKILERDIEGKLIATYDCVADYSKAKNIHQSTVYSWANNNTETADRTFLSYERNTKHITIRSFLEEHKASFLKKATSLALTNRDESLHALMFVALIEELIEEL